MSDENVGGLPEPAAILYPHSGFRRDDHAKALWRTHGYDTGGEPFYSADQLHSHAAARVHAALSAHGQPVVDAELMKRVLGAPYDGVTVGDFFVYADFSEHDTLGVVRAIVAAALGANP